MPTRFIVAQSMQGYDFGPTERIHQLDGTAAGDRDAVPAVLFPLDFDEIAGIAEQCADVIGDLCEEIPRVLAAVHSVDHPAAV
jgi:hypothetical protein